MRRFGARVTVIERGPQIASHEDPDVGSALLELFHDEGIEVWLETSVSRVEGLSGQQVRVHTQSPKGEAVIAGTDLLVAMGRTPNTRGIGLDKAAVELGEHGYIKVNERLETTAAKVWAMGECAGSPQFTHVCFDDFRVVYENLNGGNRTTKNRIIPFCMFTDPVLARVGLNEAEAKSRGIEYRLVKMPMADVLKTRTVSEPRGFMKMLVSAEDDGILGFTAFGVEGSELMAVVQTAMVGHLPYTALRQAIFTHPTVAEGLTGLLARCRPGRPGSKSGLGQLIVNRGENQMFSQIPVDLSKVKKEELNNAILRAAIIGELDAINLYKQMAALTDNEDIRKVMLDIAREEMAHVGEFQTLLLRLDQEQVRELEKGRKEVEELTGKK